MLKNVSLNPHQMMIYLNVFIVINMSYALSVPQWHSSLRFYTKFKNNNNMLFVQIVLLKLSHYLHKYYVCSINILMTTHWKLWMYLFQGLKLYSRDIIYPCLLQVLKNYSSILMRMSESVLLLWEHEKYNFYFHLFFKT